MRRILVVLACLSATFALVPLGTAQSLTGVQPFSARGAGGIDLATTEVMVDIPIRSKTGIIPFNFSLFLASPPTGGGSFGPFLAGAGGLGYDESTRTCGNGKTATMFSNWRFTDGTGASHHFPGVSFKGLGAGSSGCTNISTFPVIASDGSGYTLLANPGLGATPVYDRHGNRVDGSFGSTGSIVDPDGNFVSTTQIFNCGFAQCLTYTDTLGQVALSRNVSTSSSTGFLTSDQSFYSDSSNNSQSYTLNYGASSTYAPNFGCISNPPPPTTGGGTQNSLSTPIGDYTFTWETTPGHSSTSGYTTDRITSITYPTGASISYAYSGGTNGINCTSNVIPKTVVTVNDGNGHTYNYTYVNNNTTGPPLAAVNFTVVATDPSNNQTVYSFSGTFLTQQQFYQGGCPTSINGCSGGGTLLSTTLTCYNGNTSNCAAPTVGIANPSQIDEYTTPAGMGTSSRVSKFLDAYGNITQTVLYDFGATTPTTTIVTPIGSWNGSACVAVGNNINDRVCYKNVFDGAGNIQASEVFTYDANGHLLSHSASPTANVNSPGNLTTSATYNPNGTVATATDVNGTVTQVNYNGTGGCNGILPTSTVVAGLTTSYQWDCIGGVITQTSDANSQPTTYAYNDPLWRVTQVTDPTGAVTTTCYGLNSGGVCSPNAEQIETVLNFNSGASTVDELKTSDGLGRPIFDQRRQGPGSSSFDSTAYTYAFNSTGAVQTASIPYSGAAAVPPPAGTPVTTIQSDALGRPVSVTDGGGGQTLTSFSKNDVLKTISPAPAGENTKRKQFEYDGLGRLTSVCEITGAIGSGVCAQANSQTGYWTKYIYSAAGNLTSVTQNAQGSPTQTRTFVYDGLSRITSETNPESGTTSYIYDTGSGVSCAPNSPGDLLRKTDANGNWICYTYDALHRLTDVGNSNQSASNPCKRFRYDNTLGILGSRPSGVTVNNSLSRLTEAETDNCSAWPVTQASMITDEWFSHSARGELTDTWQSSPHSGGYYHVSTGYFANGALQALNNVGNGFNYGYGVDGEGRPNYAALTNSTLTHYVANVTYNPASQPLTISYASGDSDTYAYDPNTNRMSSYTFTVGSTPQSMVGALTWNANGTLSKLAITDGFNAAGTETCKYGDPSASVAGYDDLSRLVSANCGSVWSQSFSYDPFGNITKSGTSAWMPGYNQSNNRYTLGGTTYDAAGNLLTDTFHSYTWNVYGRPATIDGTTALTYDANNLLVEKSVSGAYTEIEYGPTGRMCTMNGPPQVQCITPLPGGSSLARGPETIWHRDWLGSVRLGSSPSSRTVTFDRAFAPFGETYDTIPGGTTNLDFAGLIQDSVGGEYDTPNRLLHPGQGRWLSPDPAGMAAVNPGNPQSWNQYTYVDNTPLSLTDPAGTNPDKFRTHHCADDGYGSVVCSGWGTPQGDPLAYWDPLQMMEIPVVIGQQLVAAPGTTQTLVMPGSGNLVTYTVGAGNVWLGPNGENVTGNSELGLMDLTPVKITTFLGFIDLSGLFQRNIGVMRRSTTPKTEGLDLSPKAVHCTLSGMATFVLDAAALLPGEGVAHALFGIGLGMVSTPISAAQGNTAGIVGGIGGMHLSALELTGSQVIKNINPIAGWAQYAWDYDHIEEDYNKCMAGN